MNIKMIGRREMAIAPTTIFVLKRAPSCSLLRSAHSRRTVRARMRPKTRKAAVIRLETAESAITARQLFGSNGTSSDPNVKTAARSKVRRIPPIARPQRCLLSNRLMVSLLSNRVAKRSLGTESRMRSTHRGRSWSPESDYGQNVALFYAQTSLWHDSQRTEANQDFYLSSPRKTCPCGQVLAISERRAKFWLPSPSAFVKVSVG